jgi:hypothetical protein
MGRRKRNWQEQDAVVDGVQEVLERKETPGGIEVRAGNEKVQ